MGSRIRACRERMKLNQERLGELVGIGKGMVSAIERGTDMPSVRVLAALGEVLGCGVDALLHDGPRVAYARESSAAGLLIEARLDALPAALRDFVLISLSLAERTKDRVPGEFLRSPTAENWAHFAAYLKAVALMQTHEIEEPG